MSDMDSDQHDKALGLLIGMQQNLIRRLADYVTANGSSLRMAADGTEGYGYNVHQLDELFLSRLNLVERTIAELQKFPAGGASRYRTQCFLASRGEVEQEINSRLERLTDARILGVSVSPAAGCDDPDACASDAGPEPSIGDIASSPDDVAPDRGAADPWEDPSEIKAPVDPQGGNDGSPGDQLLVTVLYYGPAPRAT